MENNGRSWPKFRIAFIPWSDGLVTLVRPKLLNAIHALQTSFRINQVINPSKIRFSTWLIRAVWAFGAIIRSPFWKKTFHRTVAINKKKTCVIRWHDQSTIDFSSWASPFELRSWRTKKISVICSKNTIWDSRSEGSAGYSVPPIQGRIKYQIRPDLIMKRSV